MRLSGPAMIALTVLLAGCGSDDAPIGPSTDFAEATESASAAPPGETAVANLEDSQGKAVGTATAMAASDGVMLSLRVEGMPPGKHGVHVHSVGQCDGPGFESAGGHWNPDGKMHGLENPQGQHAGDMPNLIAGPDGRATVSYKLKGGSVKAMLDADGAAMIVHAGVDDQKTDPSGNSGVRIACGVFTSG